MTSDAPEPAGLAKALRPLATLVAWIGASTGALTAVLAALGYLVEGGYLASLGLRRGMLELTPTEYIATGGQFLIGLLPMSVVGALSFLMEFWWAALFVVAVFALGARLKQGAVYRWWVCTALIGAWLAWAIPAIDALKPGSDANRLVSMMTFVAMLGLLYALLEHGAAPASRPRGTPPARVVFYAVLSVALITLPYARGAKALGRELATVHLPAKESWLLCQLAEQGSLPDPGSCAARSWRLVQLGKDRSVLLDAHNGSLYVVPAAITAMLRVAKPPSDKL